MVIFCITSIVHPHGWWIIVSHALRAQQGHVPNENRAGFLKANSEVIYYINLSCLD